MHGASAYDHLTYESVLRGKRTCQLASGTAAKLVASLNTTLHTPTYNIYLWNIFEVSISYHHVLTECTE